MHVFEAISPLRNFLKTQVRDGRSVGLVPTMGALHQGHLALIERSVRENDLTFCSIYVNPLQFNNPSDLEKYPRTFHDDKEKLEKYQNVHIFLPQDDILYQENPKIHFNFGRLEATMEGKFRPGHFNGVAIIVSKLLNIVQPDRAYFGQKDLQQCMIVRQVIQDLSFGVAMVIHPTVRESDGLALSSRNQRLNATERQDALHIPKALELAKSLLLDEKKSVEAVYQQVHAYFEGAPLRLEYFNIVRTKDLEDVQHLNDVDEIALCIAAYAGEVRLLDNIIIRPDDSGAGA